MANEERLTLRINQLTKKIEELEKTNKKYKQLAKVVHQAETWEFGIYDDIPDDSWIAINLEDYEKIMDSLSELDELEPWKTTIEKRIGRV